MNNYKLFIGLLDKDIKKQLIPTDKALEIVADKVIQAFWFGTIYTWSGVYTHDNWEVVSEPTIIVETSTDEHWLNEFIQTIWKQLNQESIFYKVENAWTCVFIK